MIKSYATLLISLALSLSGCDGRANSLAEALLTGVEDDFRLLETLDDKGVIDSDVTLAFDLKVLRKLLLIRSASASIQDLNGQGLESLCLLTDYALGTGFSELEKRDPEVVANAIDYAKSISSELRSKIGRAQTRLGGTGCEVGPKNT